MTLELRAGEFEHPEARIEGWKWRPGPTAFDKRERAIDTQPELPATTPELIERLARQLAWINGEDPDEQPRPLRHPRWHYHRGRAKALLSITPDEYLAMAAVRSAKEARESGSPTARRPELDCQGPKVA